MKRFYLFICEQYYPAGGWNDFVGSFDSIEEAVEASKGKASYGWAQIIDSQSGKEVELIDET